MFSQFGSTAENFSKASSLVLRIGTDAHLYDDPDDVSIAPLLDSKFDPEKVEALKRLLALIAQGADVSNFFPQVVKNVASQSLEVKKLVYLYLLHYAEKRPNEALLSINCFQKDLSDTNPLVRAYALRAMAGIRLHVVAPLVLAAIGKCARDPSPYVRKCAAHALTKLHDLHLEENASTLEELVGFMLSDNSPAVVGAAAIAFKSVCPSNLALIGKNFRKLCETLPDVEEWGQIVLIEILLRYVVAKHGLVRESIMCNSQLDKDSGDVSHMFESTGNSTGGSRESDGGDAGESKLNMLMYRYYIDGHEELLSQSCNINGDDGLLNHGQTSSQNDDVRILMRCTSPLLWSQNSAVVLAASGVHWLMAAREEVNRIVKPLLFVLRSSQASRYVVLCNIQMFAKAVPSLFAPYFEDFFVFSSDSYQMRALKLDILSTIATEVSVQAIFDEFQDYIRDPDRRFVADTVAAIGLCAQKLPSVANVCLEGLLTLTVQGQIDGEMEVLVQALMSIKAIIKQNPVCHEKPIVQLVRNLDIINEPAARALIVWIMGEYCSIGQIIPKVVPTLLQYLAHCFTSEELDTKHQILNTTAKVVLSSQEENLQMYKKILSYIVELAKYDPDHDVRDRARIFEKLILRHTNSPTQEEGTSFLQSSGEIHPDVVTELFSKGIPKVTRVSENNRFYLPGSLSQIVLHAAPGYGPLPKPCSVRDEDLNAFSNTNVSTEDIDDGSSSDTNDPEISSGSSFEESGSNYDSEHSNVSSVGSKASRFASDSNGDGHTDSLLSMKDTVIPPLNDAGVLHSRNSQSTAENISSSFSSGLAEIMSKSALESWLGEQSSTSSEQKSQQLSLPRVSINDLHCIIKPISHTLLDPANGNGLKLEYSFSSEVSSISPLLVLVDVFFSNHSTEQLKNISLKDGESDGTVESANVVLEKPESALPTILPVEEIAALNPGQNAKRMLHVRFLHHLLPIKLAVFCNGKKYSTKLWPEIGYFMRPLSMNLESFSDKESQLRGMFEYSKSCKFAHHVGELNQENQSSIQDDKILIVSRCLAAKVLSNANLYLLSTDIPVSFNIDDASGLRLRFSGEILSSSKPCLITLFTEGKCFEPLNVIVKINCEETTFGLNLLNKLVALLN